MKTFQSFFLPYFINASKPNICDHLMTIRKVTSNLRHHKCNNVDDDDECNSRKYEPVKL